MRALAALAPCLALAACGSPIAVDLPTPSAPFAGGVTLVWSPTTTAVLANFTTLQPGASACAGTVSGSCCAYAQPAENLGDGGVEPVTVSAGTLSISDGAQTLGSLSFTGVGYHPLSSAETPALLWNPGDTLEIQASGGSVAPFSGSLQAPPAFAALTPALDPAAVAVVHVNQDLVVTWTPPSSADGLVSLHLFDVQGYYVDCTGQDAAGSLTAPAVLFGDFLPQDLGTLTVTRESPVTLTLPNATVTLSAQATAVGDVTFE